MARNYKLRNKSPEPDPTLLEGLNPPQREAAEHKEGPLLILAGAGSGKTRVMTHRIAHLVRNEGVRPDQILAMTFTNKAAGEMRERVDRLLEGGNDAWRVTIATFHSLCARLLRRHAAEAGLTPHFVIYDEDDQAALIKNVLINEGISASPDRATVRHYRGYVERMKNAGLNPTQAHEQAFDQSAEDDAWFYERYQEALKASNCADFGDLILLVLEIFRNKPELARDYSEQWRYVMVDEFQDTNPAQYELLRHFTTTHDNLAVVGDDDQAIYRWRGATVRNILGFEERYASTKVVKLEQNYRSTQRILDVANDLIRNNSQRREKALWTDSEAGEPITCFTGNDEREEATWVANRISDAVARGTGYDEIAVFYRMNSLGRAFEEQLRFAGIPYQVIGGVSFYARAEVKDVLAYLKVALNPTNEVDLLRVLNRPTRGVGSTSLEKLRAAAALPEVGSVWAAIEWYVSDAGDAAGDEPPPGWLPGLDHVEWVAPELEDLRNLRGKPATGLREFHSALSELRQDLSATSDLAQIVQGLVVELGYLDWLRKSEPERGEDKVQNVNELVNALAEFERDTENGLPVDASPTDKLRAFLDRSALLASIDNFDEEVGAVTLMTVHGSKGLEFDTVFLTGLEDEIFPSLRDDDDHAEELAEERRLAYVAITRAKRKLYMSHAMRRRVFGQFRDASPSRFLREIDAEHLEIDPRSSRAARGRNPWQRRGAGRPPGGRNLGRDSAAWDFDQSATMVRNEVTSAVEAARRAAPAYDEFSQVNPWDDIYEPPAHEALQESAGEVLQGRTVSHSRFGLGVVLSVSGKGDKATVEVSFADGSQKKIKRQWLKVLG